MKNLCGSFLVICSFFWFSCNNELDLNAPAKEIPVVYGVLDPSEEIQYIRLERAFNSDELTPAEIAKISDSLYYQNAQVQLIRLSNEQMYSLQKIDGNDESLFREEGIFTTKPNVLYKIQTSDIQLIPGETIQLRIVAGRQSEPVEGLATILEPVLITRPSSSSRLDFDEVDRYTIKWSGEDDAIIHNLTILIHIEEIKANTENTTTTLKWNVARNIRGQEYMGEGGTFYRFLAENLVASANVNRRFLSAEVVVESSGEDLKKYQNVGQANLGLTATQETPAYSNLINGLGLFTAKSTGRRNNLQITSGTLDSLRNGRFTRDLNFR